MYKISEQQVDYILNHIRESGITLESLQNDILDHVCCIIENNFDSKSDFKQFYHATIKQFYKKELKEIEEETVILLTNKNYYTMKKVMIISGIISAALLTMGIILKFLHQPGASFGIVVGVASFSLIFLPLMFTLKMKEKQLTKDKILLALGSLTGILISMAIMFKIMHWPWANVMGIASVGILILFYLPINLITGIKNPETKINTIVSSILLIAGCGLFLSLARSPQGSRIQYIKDTSYFVRNNQLFLNEYKQLQNDIEIKNTPTTSLQQSEQIIELCEELKSYLIEKETGIKSLDANFEINNAWLGDSFVDIYFPENSDAKLKYKKLIALIKTYNASNAPGLNENLMQLPPALVLQNMKNERVTHTLNNLVQLQQFVLQNERAMAFNN